MLHNTEGVLLRHLHGRGLAERLRPRDDLVWVFYRYNRGAECVRLRSYRVQGLVDSCLETYPSYNPSTRGGTGAGSAGGASDGSLAPPADRQWLSMCLGAHATEQEPLAHVACEAQEGFVEVCC